VATSSSGKVLEGKPIHADVEQACAGAAQDLGR